MEVVNHSKITILCMNATLKYKRIVTVNTFLQILDAAKSNVFLKSALFRGESTSIRKRLWRRRRKQ